jgi:hypothetical protein
MNDHFTETLFTFYNTTTLFEQKSEKKIEVVELFFSRVSFKNLIVLQTY